MALTTGGSRIRSKGFGRIRKELLGNGLRREPAPGTRAEERRLLAAARGGDAAAMRRLLDRVAGTVYRFGRGFCRNPEDAEDVMQDVFLALTRSLRQFRGESSLSSWAYVVARRACSRSRRRRSGEPGRFESLEENGEAGDRHAIGIAADPAGTVEQSELRSVLEAGLAALPESQRDVLALRDVEGLSAREVARALRISERVVKSRLHRARLSMRATLQAYRDGHAPPALRARGCPDTPRLLSRFLEGEMNARECARVERHVSGCLDCRGACDSLRDTLRACRRLGTASVPRAMRARLRRAIRQVVKQSHVSARV